MARSWSPASALAVLCLAAEVLLPPPDMTVAEWADEFRVLSREDSAAPGRWSCEARPYQRGIMEASSAPRIQHVTVVGGAQWGKTQILNNIVGHRVHLNPGPMMVVQPTERAGEKWSKTRLAPMIRDCPELAARVLDKARDSSNTILEKTFPGGLLVIVGANAPAGLASQPIRDLLMDEVDRIPMDETVGDEGDFEDLAEARTSDFEGRRLIYKCSTPTILGHSRIQNSWNESDQRDWHIACPHCGFEQTLDWKNVCFRDDAGNYFEPFYACHGGGCQITEPQLRAAVLKGRWVAARPDILDHAGFRVVGLMVRPMATLVKKFRSALRKGPGALQVFKNTQLGEWWDPREGDSLQAEGLQKRAQASTYVQGQVPNGVGLLVGSVDVQADRLEFLVMGVGVGEETWRVAREVIPGNPATPEPWDRLEESILQNWPRIHGGTMNIRLTVIDIGYQAREVYRFCRRPKLKGKVLPIKGNPRPQLKLAVRSGSKARLWLVDTIQGKDQVLHRLKIETPGFGYCHYPSDLEGDYFEQLLAERRVPGKRIYKKVTEDARNEALDLEVYALAALFILSPRNLDALVAKASGQAPPAQDPDPDPEPEPSTPTAPREIPERAPRIITPRRPGFPRFGGGGSGAW